MTTFEEGSCGVGGAVADNPEEFGQSIAAAFMADIQSPVTRREMYGKSIEDVQARVVSDLIVTAKGVPGDIVFPNVVDVFKAMRAAEAAPQSGMGFSIPLNSSVISGVTGIIGDIPGIGAIGAIADGIGTVISVGNKIAPGYFDSIIGGGSPSSSGSSSGSAAPAPAAAAASPTYYSVDIVGQVNINEPTLAAAVAQAIARLPVGQPVTVTYGGRTVKSWVRTADDTVASVMGTAAAASGSGIPGWVIPAGIAVGVGGVLYFALK
jgi:hypothetical protein